MTAAGTIEPGTIHPEDLADFAQAIEQRFGHQPDARRDQDLRDVLRARLHKTGARGYQQYRANLNQKSAEWEALAPLLTVPETYFFRMPEHFEALITSALPKLMAMRRDTRTLRILSAGCATGEEPYTLRILLNERMPELASWRITIDGVDLSEAALTRARTGVYSDWSLRATSEPRRKQWFKPSGKHFQLAPQARTGVQFRRENLLESPPAFEAPYDVIFCRNVLIYFTEAAMRTAIAHLTSRLAPEGYLFLGPAESLRGMSRDFHLCHAQDTFFYRRKLPEAQTSGAPKAQGVPHLASEMWAASPQPSPQEPFSPPDETWFDAIRSSSERLATLVKESGKPAKQRASAQAPRQTRKAQPAPASFLKLIEGEQFAEALALLETLPARPEEKGLLRASLLTNMGRYAEAEVECHRLLAVDELNPGTHYLLGLGREQTGRLEEAEVQMRAASYLDPGFAMAHLHRGLIARRRGQISAAQAAFELALQALEHEAPERIALFGGGFSREGLRKLCAGEAARTEKP